MHQLLGQQGKQLNPQSSSDVIVNQGIAHRLDSRGSHTPHPMIPRQFTMPLLLGSQALEQGNGGICNF